LRRAGNHPLQAASDVIFHHPMPPRTQHFIPLLTFLYYVLAPLRYGITIRHAIIPSGSSPFLHTTKTAIVHPHRPRTLTLRPSLPHFLFPRVYVHLLMNMLHFLSRSLRAPDPSESSEMLRPSKCETFRIVGMNTFMSFHEDVYSTFLVSTHHRDHRILRMTRVLTGDDVFMPSVVRVCVRNRITSSSLVATYLTMTMTITYQQSYDPTTPLRRPIGNGPLPCRCSNSAFD